MDQFDQYEADNPEFNDVQNFDNEEQGDFYQKKKNTGYQNEKQFYEDDYNYSVQGGDDYDDQQEQIDQALDLIRNRKVNEGLEKIEIVIYRAQDIKGPQAFQKSFQKIIKMMNNEAVQALNNNEWESTLLILTKCDQLTQPHKFGIFTALRAQTYNNFGCYFRRMQDLPNALNSLEKALRLLNMANTRETLGVTYLNLCAVLSEMGEHNASLENAKKAVIEIHRDYLDYLRGRNFNELKQDTEFLAKARSLAIAFHNVGVEEEYFQNYEMCLLNYGNSCQVAEDNLGPNHRLTIKFRYIFNEFNKKLQIAESNPKKVFKARPAKKRPLLNKKQIGKNRPTSASNSNNSIDQKIQPYKKTYNARPQQFVQQGNNIKFKDNNHLPNQNNRQNFQQPYHQQNNSQTSFRMPQQQQQQTRPQPLKYQQKQPILRHQQNNFMQKQQNMPQQRPFKQYNNNQGNQKVQFNDSQTPGVYDDNYIKQNNNNNVQQRPTSAHNPSLKNPQLQQRPQSAAIKHQKQPSSRIQAGGVEDVKQLDGIISWSESSEGEEDQTNLNKQNFIDNINKYGEEQDLSKTIEDSKKERIKQQKLQALDEEQRKIQQKIEDEKRKEQELKYNLDNLQKQKEQFEKLQEQQRKQLEQQRLKEQEEKLLQEEQRKLEEQQRQEKQRELEELIKKQQEEQEKLKKIQEEQIKQSQLFETQKLELEQLRQQSPQKQQQEAIVQPVVQVQENKKSNNYITIGEEQKIHAKDSNNESDYFKREGQFGCLFEKNLFIIVFYFRDQLTKQGSELKDQCQHNIRLDNIIDNYEDNFEENQDFLQFLENFKLNVQNNLSINITNKSININTQNADFINSIDKSKTLNIKQINSRLSMFVIEEKIQQQQQPQLDLNKLLNLKNKLLNSQKNTIIINPFEQKTLCKTDGIFCRYIENQEKIVIKFIYQNEKNIETEAKYEFIIKKLIEKEGEYSINGDNNTSIIINKLLQYYEDKMSMYLATNILFFHDPYKWSYNHELPNKTLYLNVEKRENDAILNVISQKKEKKSIIQEQQEQQILQMVGFNIEELTNKAITGQTENTDRQEEPQTISLQIDDSQNNQKKYDKEHDQAVKKIQRSHRRKQQIKQRKHNFNKRFETMYKKTALHHEYRLSIWVFHDNQQQNYKIQIYSLESKIERKERNLKKFHKTLQIDKETAEYIKTYEEPFSKVETDFQNNQIILKEQLEELQRQQQIQKAEDYLSEQKKLEQQYQKDRELVLPVVQEELTKIEDSAIEKYNQDQFEEQENKNKDQKMPDSTQKYTQTQIDAANRIKKGLQGIIRHRKARESLKQLVKKSFKTLVRVNKKVDNKIVQFQILKKFDPRKYFAQVQLLYVRKDERWNSKLILTDMVATQLGREYQENKKIDIQEYFDIIPSQRHFAIKKEAEQLLATKIIQNKLQSYYQIIAKGVYNTPTKARYLITIQKDMQKKAVFSANIETIKPEPDYSPFSQQIIIQKYIASNIVRLYDNKQLQVSEIFDVDASRQEFSLKQNSKEYFAVLTIQRTLRHQVKIHNNREQIRKIVQEYKQKQECILLFQRQFQYQTFKLIFSIINHKKNKQCYAHIQAIKIDKKKDQNKVNAKCILKKYVANYIANQFNNNKKDFQPQQFVKI